MSARNHVHDALRRWQRGGLIDGTLADHLRAETDAHAATEGRRWAQYAVATTGAVILVIAASVFLRWAWPLMGPGSRSVLLGGAGVVTMALGIALDSRTRLAPAEYLLRAASLAILLMAFGYSRRAWDDSSIGAIVFGLGILAVPLVTAGLAIRRKPIMPAIHAAFGYAFLYLFLERATPLHGHAILWIMDGIAALSVLLLALRLRDVEHRAADDWTLNAFTASLYAAGVLMFFTAAAQLDEYRSAVWALDVWLLAVGALTVWGIHAAPVGLRRTWFGKQLAFCVLLAIVFGWWTTLGALRLGEASASLVVASIGAVGLYYGLRFDARDTIVASCIALLTAAWYFGTEAGGAIGAILALAFSAALFFWISTRLTPRS